MRSVLMAAAAAAMLAAPVRAQFEKGRPCKIDDWGATCFYDAGGAPTHWLFRFTREAVCALSGALNVQALTERGVAHAGLMAAGVVALLAARRARSPRPGLAAGAAAAVLIYLAWDYATSSGAAIPRSPDQLCLNAAGNLFMLGALPGLAYGALRRLPEVRHDA